MLLRVLYTLAFLRIAQQAHNFEKWHHCLISRLRQQKLCFTVLGIAWSNIPEKWHIYYYLPSGSSSFLIFHLFWNKFRTAIHIITYLFFPFAVLCKVSCDKRSKQVSTDYKINRDLFAYCQKIVTPGFFIVLFFTRKGSPVIVIEGG